MSKIDIEQVKIVWEDFNSNYLPPDKIEAEKDPFEDEQNSALFDQLNMLNGMGGNVAKTPWGSFGKDDKMAPHNFYELKLIHFYGFSSEIFSYKDSKGAPKNKLSTVLGNATGVAVWKFLDPYCFVIGKAKLYTWAEVTKSVDASIKGALIDLNQAESIEKIVDELIEEGVSEENLIKAMANTIISEFKKNNVDEGSVAIIFPNGKYDFAILTDPDYSERVKRIEELVGTVEGALVIRNGQICQ